MFFLAAASLPPSDPLDSPSLVSLSHSDPLQTPSPQALAALPSPPPIDTGFRFRGYATAKARGALWNHQCGDRPPSSVGLLLDQKCSTGVQSVGEIRQHDLNNIGEGTGVARDVGLSRTGCRVFAGGAVTEGSVGTGLGELGWEGTEMEKRRKELEVEELEFRSEESQEASEELAKPPLSRASSKMSRATEVHNLYEKRRRHRINEKMKALQKLIPNANKTDKASMLDEVIDYLKQLQLQVQVSSFLL